jgi:hypothetical protein
MTATILRPGMFQAPNVGPLNRLLAEGGLKAEVLVVDCNAGLNFGRTKPKAVTEPEQIQEWQDALNNSVNTVTDILGLGRTQDGVANVTAIGLTSTPQRMPHQDLIRSTIAAGYTVEENPHEPCLALVSNSDLSIGLGLITPFADAPPVYLVYVGFDRFGVMFVVTASIQAIWHRLPVPTFDDAPEVAAKKANLIQSTLNKMAYEVEGHGVIFDIKRVWAFVGPGASEEFYVGGKYAALIGPDYAAQYVVTKLVPADPTNANFMAMARPSEYEGWMYIDELNLRGWVAGLLRDAGVPDRQVSVVEHDTVNSMCYSSKRGRERGINLLQQPITLPSNVLVGAVTRL